MPSERIQRQIDRLLDEAEQALGEGDWELGLSLTQRALTFDPDNVDAAAFLATAQRGLATTVGSGIRGQGTDPSAPPAGAGLRPTLPEGPDTPLGQMADSATSGAGEAPAPPDGTTQSSALIPQSFANGRYTVKRFLGEGGKKRVYLAHDTTLDRDVAFALIKTDGLDDTARERIAREAQAMGRLGAHPHIVTVFDLGDEAGQPYMVTELMGGGDVEGAIEKAPEHKLPLPQALAIAEQVCQGLEFAHGQKIVHRDLKPGNVWLTAHLTPGPFPSREGESDRSLSLTGEGQGEGETRAAAGRRAAPEPVAKIGDFGLAIAIDRTRLTQAGMMIGTVSYMPPEQATGGEVTARSDLYSLGAMLYELVTGRPPFVGDEAVAIIGQHLNTPPVAPTWHRPDCPPGLEALILRLLEKNPSKRPTSAGEVREALGHLLEAGAMNRAPTEGRGNSPLSLAGEGGGEGETRAGGAAQAALENPLYRRVFVGREQEVRQLQGAFDAALSGKGSLAMVVGEPGIGKTAICEQLAIYVTLRGGTTLTGHCYEEGSLSLPYLAFVEALRGYASSRPPEDLRRELGTAASDLARIVSEVRERLAVEPRPPGDPEEDRWRLLQAVSGFLRNASAVQPLLLVLEDLHWADQGTLDLLVHLARNLQGARLLVIGTYRDVEVDRSHPLSATLAELRRGAEFGRVLLRGLGTPEVQRMLLAITGAEVPGSLAESIHRQTEGNPLFVQEVVRYMVEEGHLAHGASGATAAGMAIPEGLRDVIGRRIARLSLECNRLLAIAAVIGRDFGLATLQTVSGSPREEVAERLEEAVRTAVLTEQEHVGEVQYRFAHAFFRQTLYEELGAARRIQFHQQVARALEAQYANRLSEHAAELAEHFAHSSVPEDLGKAVRYAEAAAERALSVYAYGEAVRHLEQALDVQEVLDPDDKAKRCDLLLTLGDALISLGETTRAVQEVAPEAVRLADAMSDRRRASSACRIVQRARGVTSAIGVVVDLADWANRADSYADEGTIERVYADVMLALVPAEQGDSAHALTLLRRAANLALQLDDPVSLVMSAVPLLNGPVTPPEAHGERLMLAEELSKRSLAGVNSTGLANTLLYLGQVYFTWGRREEAERHWRQAKEAAQRSRDAEIAFVPYQIDALVQTLDGNLEQLIDIGDQIRERAEDVDRETAGRQIGARAVRRALIYLGRVDEALAGIPDFPSWFAGNGVFAGQRALCLAQLGQAAQAQQILNGFLAARDMGSQDDPTPVAVLRYLLETSVLLNDADAARVLEGRMAQLAGLLHTEADMCYNIGRLLGGAAALLGETDKARGYYQQALEVCEKVRFRPEIALTRLELAELMLGEAGPHPLTLSPKTGGRGTTPANPASPLPELGEGPGVRAVRTEALAHLDFAIAEFREMKMQPSLERALRHKDLLKA